MENNVLKSNDSTSARKLDIQRIIEKAERLKELEAKEKEWLKRQEVQQAF